MTSSFSACSAEALTLIRTTLKDLMSVDFIFFKYTAEGGRHLVNCDLEAPVVGEGIVENLEGVASHVHFVNLHQRNSSLQVEYIIICC
jgi:hypothetical protein